jgi:ABC-type transporter Mla maintaining outer membrane lipid asymmetry ATPase subunit MlaF
MAEAIALADRIGVLDAGQLIWSGPARGILQADDERVRRLVEAVTVTPLAAAEDARA